MGYSGVSAVPSRNPFIFLGHFNLCPVCLEPSEDCRNPFIFLGHFNEVTEELWKEARASSQSLHFLRAFQLEGLRDVVEVIICRNPFIFLGHFNNQNSATQQPTTPRRNPFIFLGHFNNLKKALRYLSECESQSLHFLRAFQPEMGVAVILYDKSRNPFIFLGHFNS